MNTTFDEAEQCRFETDGFVVRRDVFDVAEVQQIRDTCERLVGEMVERRNGRRAKAGSYVFEPIADINVLIKWEGDTDVVHGLEPLAHISPEIRAWALDARFIDPMRSIFGGDDPILFTEKLNLKRAHLGGPNPLHQDYPYWVNIAADPKRVATAMLNLDDTTVENGCLWVLPGSHAGGPGAKRADMDAFGNLELDDRRYADAELVAVDVPAGSVVYFGSFLVHRSAPNTTDHDRRALLFSYGPSERRHMSDVFADGALRRRPSEA